LVGIARGQDSSFPETLVSIDPNDSWGTAEDFANLTKHHSFDGVVNNAGLTRLHRVGETDLKDVDDIMRFNLHPAIQTVQAVLPAMRAKGWGHIVSISSLTVVGFAQRSAYTAAKAALSSFPRTWALELVGPGITVNAVTPGPAETELFRQNTPVGSEAERVFLSLLPIRRLDKQEEIAAAGAFLLPDEAGYTTVQTHSLMAMAQSEDLQSKPHEKGDHELRFRVHRGETEVTVRIH
jgi:NAD(P)-dependent dehydrogenase (short-subunit alcohol dehydrogenase family)